MRGWALAARLTVAGVAASALAGCFQPMYATTAPDGGPGLRERLGDVDVVPITGEVGHELRNALIYDFNGGGENPAGAPYQLIVKPRVSKSTALVNKQSGLPENEIIQLTADWQLVQANDPKKPALVKGVSKGSASIDTSYQRYANYAAAKDAEKRATREVVADIRTQLIAWFLRPAPVAGK